MKLNPETVDGIFEKAEHQAEALIAIYRLVFPDWDDIKAVDGFPVIGQEGWLYICDHFIELDKARHPGVWKGGLWLNKGFSSSNEVSGWEVSLDSVKIER